MGECTEAVIQAGHWWSWATVTICVLVGMWVVSVCVIDATTRRIPNALSLPAAGAVMVVAVVFPCREMLAGAVGWWCVCLCVQFLVPRADAGAGDAKLAFGLGGCAAAVGGVPAVCAAIAGAGVLGALTVVLLEMRARRGVGEDPARRDGVGVRENKDSRHCGSEGFRPGSRADPRAATAPQAPAMVIATTLVALYVVAHSAR